MKKLLLFVLICSCLMLLGCNENLSTIDNCTEDQIIEIINESNDNKQDVNGGGNNNQEDNTDPLEDDINNSHNDEPEVIDDNPNEPEVIDDNPNEPEVIDDNPNEPKATEIIYDDECINKIKNIYRDKKGLSSTEEVVIKYMLGVYGPNQDIYAAIIEGDCVEMSKTEKYYYAFPYSTMGLTVTDNEYQSFHTKIDNRCCVEFEYLPEVISIYYENKYYNIWDACNLEIIYYDVFKKPNNELCLIDPIKEAFDKIINTIPEDEKYSPQVSDEDKEDYKNIQEIYYDYFNERYDYKSIDNPEDVIIKHYLGRYGENNDIYVAVVFQDYDCLPNTIGAKYSQCRFDYTYLDIDGIVKNKVYSFWYLDECISFYKGNTRYGIWEVKENGLLSKEELDNIFEKFCDITFQTKLSTSPVIIDDDASQVIKSVYANYLSSKESSPHWTPEQIVIKYYFGAYGASNDIYVAIVQGDTKYLFIDAFCYFMKLSDGSYKRYNYTYLPEAISVYHNDAYYEFSDACDAGLLSEEEMDEIFALYSVIK